VHRFVHNQQCHKRGQFEILQADADLGGALADRADVRRGGENLVDMARALFGTIDGVLKLQPGDRWEWVSIKLNNGYVTIKLIQASPSHPELVEHWQLAQLGRQPFELIVVDLGHTLGSDDDPPIRFSH
jgi:hypothetical protein